jgi:hypothetical protein
MKNDRGNRDNPTPNFARGGALKSTIACGWKCSIAGAAVALLPLSAQAADYPIDPAAVNAWIAMVTASQAAQPR